MLEIKCPMTRKLNGDVLHKKTEMYWAQMQLQLEVCDLFECDFAINTSCPRCIGSA